MAYLDLIRPKNLLIVAFTQLFFQYVIIIPAFSHLGLTLALSQINLALLVLCTLMITAGGNIINDYFDREIDISNNRKTASLALAKKEILYFYKLVVIIGAMIALFVAWDIENIKLFTIYPVAVSLLFFYSYKLKHLPLIGNIIVSLFTALVIFILLYAERDNVAIVYESDHIAVDILHYCSIGFMAFAFLSNLIREIVKDLEDIEGDRLNGSKTLPVVYGIKTSKVVATVILIILLVSLLIWPMIDVYSNCFTFNRVYLRLILTLPIFYFLNELYRAQYKNHYHQLSQELKLYMIVGLFYLPFYYLI